MTHSMFETLLQLPLFQGLAHDDFTHILAKVQMNFMKHKAGERIATAQTPCNQLIFVIKGEVQSITTAPEGNYALHEFFEAPCLLEAHSMFGMHQLYTATYTAKSEVHTVSISKQLAITHLFSYEIFRMNYQNIVSNRAQLLRNRLWSFSQDCSCEARILHFISSRCERCTGEKRLKVKMEDLARLLNDTRPAISRTLNNLKEKGFVELKRGEIIIPALESIL